MNILHIILICFSCVQQGTRPDSQENATLTGDPIPGALHFSEYLSLLKGKQVACVVNHTSLTGTVHLVDTLTKLGITIEKVFAPEHGFRGTADAGELITDGKDPVTGIPIFSLYGDKKKPAPDDLEGIDVVLFDIQDLGVRFYTYISTLFLVMEACAENSVPLIVLDRPNPNGYYVDGPILKPEHKSFVGMLEIPVVYGMTMGELALMINGEHWLSNDLKCTLKVVACRQYNHNMTYMLPVAPSPNIPNLRAALLYPSICFFEGTNVSVGRGTDKQFQVLGHTDYPTRQFTFTPESKPGAMNPPHRGVTLYGSDLTELSIAEIQSWKRLNLQWLIEYHHLLNPQEKFFLPSGFFEKLAGTDDLRKQLNAGWMEDQIRATWQHDLEAFKAKRQKYLLYPDFEE